MQDTSPLLNYQAITDDDHEIRIVDETSYSLSSGRRSVLTGAILVLAASFAVIFQTGYFGGSSSVEVASFAAFARRDPGEPMLNTDELWPCKADPQIPMSTCDQGKVLDGTHTYSNVYVDTGYPTTNLPPYKMVYYKNNIWLYARQYATSDCAWSKIFTQVVGGGLFCDGVEITADDWGTPYWKMSDHVPELKPKKLNKKKVTRLEFDANKNDERYSIKFQKVRLTNKGVKYSTKFRLDLIRPVWNCDKVQFILNTDGNLCLATYQSPEARAVTKMQCNVLFQSNNFMYNGGATLSPTAEPTAASGGINDSLEGDANVAGRAIIPPDDQYTLPFHSGHIITKKTEDANVAGPAIIPPDDDDEKNAINSKKRLSKAEDANVAGPAIVPPDDDEMNAINSRYRLRPHYAPILIVHSNEGTEEIGSKFLGVDILDEDETD